jgi:glucokinase
MTIRSSSMGDLPNALEAETGAQERALTIGVDIGGTKVAAGVVNEEGAIIDTTRRDTPADDPMRTADVVADAVRELVVMHDVAAIGLGAAGFVDAERSTVMFAPNLAWRDEPLRAAMEQRLGLPVVVENDANAAAWAEARFGAGRGEDYVIVITVGTGIGGGIVVGGQLLRGRFGVAAEIGHLNIVPDGRRCGCGLQGCWEQYASGRALVQEAYEQAIASPALARELLRRAGGDPERITGPMVTQAAQDGDVAALQCFDEIGRWLGRGMAQLAAILDPGVFVIGGGVSAAGDLLREPAMRTYRKHLTARGHRPPTCGWPKWAVKPESLAPPTLPADVDALARRRGASRDPDRQPLDLVVKGQESLTGEGSGTADRPGRSSSAEPMRLLRPPSSHTVAARRAIPVDDDQSPQPARRRHLLCQAQAVAEASAIAAPLSVFVQVE